MSDTIDRQNDFFEDIDIYHDSFDCNECGGFGIENFRYDRTVANGEVWNCKKCNAELLTMEQPNEDNY